MLKNNYSYNMLEDIKWSIFKIHFVISGASSTTVLIYYCMVVVINYL